VFGRPRKLLAGALTALALGSATATLSLADSPSDYNWTEVLPANPSASGPQPRPVRGCRKATVRCVVLEARRLRALQARFGCDHRGVFATTYLELTREALATVRRNPRFFRYPRYFFREDALFANVYFKAVRAWHHGGRVPEAWRVAFETARDADVNAAQDMLLGINAHVQNDMPFVLASLGLRTQNGRSRKSDHDAMNAVLDRAYERVVRAVERRFDPAVGTTNSTATPLDDIAGIELVREWRENVWRNAERLVSAENAAERRQVAAQIQDYAGGWARSIAAFETPGYRAERDAYCRSRLGSAGS
jgi:hypothetical protein